jgi:transposase
MLPRFLSLHPQTYRKLQRLQRQAEVGGEYRLARRLHAVLLNHDGYTSGAIAGLLQAPRSCVAAWLATYEQQGWESLREGERPGRPSELAAPARRLLGDILDSGPVAYGFLSGLWTSPMVARVIAEEFGVSYHPGHVCRLLHALGFSRQRPQRLLIRADPLVQAHWRQHIYPGIKAVCRQGRALVFEDEASFRQDATLAQTWARRGQTPRVPMTGERHSVKVFGCIEIYSGRFLFHFEPVFNAAAYVRFWEQVARAYYPQPLHYIHDNASYHLDGEVQSWLAAERRWWHTHALPKYSPEDNAAEPIWRHVRRKGTHNRYFVHRDELAATLVRCFRSIQQAPLQIDGYLQPFH